VSEYEATWYSMLLLAFHENLIWRVFRDATDTFCYVLIGIGQNVVVIPSGSDLWLFAPGKDFYL